MKRRVLMVLVLSLGTVAAGLPPVQRSAAVAEGPLQGLAAVAQCPPDEYEPNESFAAARAISVGVENTAYICPSGDEDWFKFYASAGQQITVDLYGLYGNLPADYDLYLQDPWGAGVGESASGGGAVEQIVHTAQQTGEYRVRVIGYVGAYSATYPYRLQVSLSGAPAATPTPTATTTPECPPDGYEPNESFAAARAISVGVENTAYICPSGDEDWFKFYASAGQEITVDLYGLYGDLPADYDLYLQDPWGAGVGESASGGGAVEQIVHTAQQTGEYRVRVIGYVGAYSAMDPYRLQVTLSGAPTATQTATRTPTFTPTATNTATSTPTHTLTATPSATLVTCPTVHEPNDTFEEAATLPINESVVSFICPASDVDTFRFYAEAGQGIEAILYDMSYDGRLELYDPSEVSLGQSNNPGTAMEEVAITASTTGWHYLRVSGTEDNEVNPYSVQVTLGGQPLPTDTPTPTPTLLYPNCPDAFEPNDWCGADKPAWELTASGYWSYICASNDTDYWRIPSVQVGQTMDIALDPAGYNYFIRLYDPQCGVVTQSTVERDGYVRLRHAATVTGTWYVQVLNQYGSYSTEDMYHITAGVYDCPRDRLESNDDRTNASLLSLSTYPQSERELNICPPGEQDWFAVLPKEGETLLADLTHYTPQGFLRMCLYKGSADTPLLCTDPYFGLNRIDYLAPDSDGRYLVVEPATPGGSNPDYDITVQVQIPPTATATPTPTRTLTPTRTRTPTHTPSPTRPSIDLRVETMEVTQGLQNWNNDIPLVAGKGTYLRVYISSNRHAFKAVGDVRAFLDGVPLSPASTSLSEVNMTGAVSNVDIRKDVRYTLNCFLPRTWLERPGKLKLIATVAAQGAHDPTPLDNEGIITLDVEASPELHIQAVRVLDGGFLGIGAQGPTYEDYKDIHTLIQHMYPVARVRVWAHKHTILWLTGPLTLVELMAVDLLDRDPGPNTVIMGMVRKEVWAPLAAGMGLPTGHCWVKLLSWKELLAAHEAGHGFGMWHVNACGEHAPFETYPFPSKQISWGGLSDYWGITFLRYPPRVLPGSDYADVMTYCAPPPRWISSHTYFRLRARLRSGAGLQAAGTSRVVHPLADTDYLMVLGILASDGMSATLQSTLRVPGADLDPQARISPDGDYALQLLAGDGQVLDEVSFGIAEGNHQEDGQPFSVLIPWHPGTNRILIRHESAELASRSLSAHAPEVTFDPVSDVIHNTLLCSWSASDADGDDLMATLLLSTDNGQSWEGVASGIPGNRFELDTSFWPGTAQARLRVLVSDGLHTSEALSNAFVVPQRPPVAFILTPEDGATAAPGDPVFLRATGYDAEDGPLGDEAYTWASDRDGALGSGEEAVAGALSRGLHTITLLATDSDGHVAEQTVRLWVGGRAYLPMILR